MIKLKGAVKKFDDFNALDGVDIEIGNGAAFGLLGSNGAGKSTVLRLLSGIYEADGGTVEIDGENVFDNADIKRRVFFINDETVQYSGMSLDNLRKYFSGFYPNFSNELFDKLNDTIKLPEKKTMDKFSKGMKRQAVVITALACRTDYLFLDEAFDGLDPTMRNIVKRMLVDEMLDRGLTTVISSHNLKEINEICDSAALMHRGKVLFCRDLDSLKGEVHKIQAAFDKSYTKEDFHELEVLHFEQSGSLTYMIVKGTAETVETAVRKKTPLVFDMIPLTLEEIFIYEMEEKGYDCKGIDFTNIG